MLGGHFEVKNRMKIRFRCETVFFEIAVPNVNPRDPYQNFPFLSSLIWSLIPELI